MLLSQAWASEEIRFLPFSLSKQKNMMNLLVIATCFEYFILLTNIINMIYEAIKNRKKHKIDFFEYTQESFNQEQKIETFNQEQKIETFNQELNNDTFNQELNNDTFNQDQKGKKINQDQKKIIKFGQKLMENGQERRSILNSSKKQLK